MHTERMEVVRMLVGSKNYNLNTEESDKDYRVFYLPTFEDILYNRLSEKKIITEDIDLSYEPISKLPNSLWKSGIYNLEVLFSEEITINDDLSDESKEMIQWLLLNRELIAQANIYDMYSVCRGTYYRNIKELTVFSEKQSNLKELHKYNTKKALVCFRNLDFLERYYNTNFTDFKKSITYTGEERSKMLDIKHGKYSLEEMTKLLEEKLAYTEKTYSDIYGKITQNLGTIELVNEKIANLLKYEYKFK